MTDKSTDNIGQSKLVTIVEAAEILGKSERTIRRMMSAGKIPVVKTNGRTLIQMAGIDSMDDMTAGAVNMPVKSYDNSDTYRDRLEQQYKETIKRLEDENSKLWNMVQSMLPAPTPANVPQNDRQGYAIPLWSTILIILVTAALIIGGVVWLTK